MTSSCPPCPAVAAALRVPRVEGFFKRSNLRRPLTERALEHRLGYAVPQDLERAARDHPAAAFPEAPLDERVLRIAHAAHDLHRFVRDVEAGLIAEELRDRRVF